MSAAIRQGARTERLDVANVHVPALLIFARGPLPDQVTLSDDLWQAIRTDEREYGNYFQKYLLRIMLRRMSPRLPGFPQQRQPIDVRASK